MPDPVTVLVVDDSAFMRKMVTEILSQAPALRVVGQARDGADALQKLETLRPDVVTLDVEMPVMDGFTALAEIMRRRPTPVVMLSSLTQAGADATVRCLAAGAVDFVGKPSGAISLDIQKVGAELAAKIAVAARARLRPGGPHPRPLSQEQERGGRVGAPLAAPCPGFAAPPSGAAPPPHALPAADPPGRPCLGRAKRREGSLGHGVLFIGASTGGPRALQTVVPALPADLGVPVVVVQHMPPGFTASLARRLDADSPLDVREAAEGDTLRPNIVLVAPGGQHLVFDPSGAARLTDEPPVHGVRPSVDVTLASLARLCGARVTAVLLTGMGKDGARGLKAVRDLGGQTMAEDESTCVVYGMPKAALDMGGVGRMLPLPAIAAAAAEAVMAQAVRRTT